MTLSRHQLVTESLDCLENGDAQGVLARVRTFVDTLFYKKEETAATIYAIPEGDGLCRIAGRQVLDSLDPPAIPPGHVTGPEDAPVDVYLATEIYHHGGHTPLIGDYVRNSAGREAYFLLSNIDNHKVVLDDEIRARVCLPEDRIHLCPDGEEEAKLRWLFEQIRALRPERVFLFHHQHDSAAVAAVQIGLAREFYFVHHVDYHPTLGIDLPGVTHIDLTPYCYHHCRIALGLQDNIFIPLQSHDDRPRDYAAALGDPWHGDGARGRPLQTASSGSIVKFLPEGAYPYPEVIAGLLSRNGGSHVHIGKLPAEFLDRVTGALEEDGIDPDRFQYVERVPSLGAAMAEFGIDLYLDSFPVGGAKGSVDVLGSATPVAYYWEEESSRYRETHMAYPEALIWHTPEDLYEQIAEIDRAWLVEQSRFARRHFEDVHSESRIASLFQDPNGLQGLAPRSAEGISFAAELRRLYDHYHRIAETTRPAEAGSANEAASPSQ